MKKQCRWNYWRDNKIGLSQHGRATNNIKRLRNSLQDCSSRFIHKNHTEHSFADNHNFITMIKLDGFRRKAAQRVKAMEGGAKLSFAEIKDDYSDFLKYTLIYIGSINQRFEVIYGY